MGGMCQLSDALRIGVTLSSRRFARERVERRMKKKGSRLALMPKPASAYAEITAILFLNFL